MGPRIHAGGGVGPRKSKKKQENARKTTCISLHSLGRIGTFQWVTANPNKKFLLRLNSRGGLWAPVANRALPPTRGRARSSLPELLIAAHYSNCFCLIQEKPRLL